MDKHVHVAMMEEIAENGFNLNIPRYVDTIEEEELIGVVDVYNEIQEISAKREETIGRANQQLRILGLL